MICAKPAWLERCDYRAKRHRFLGRQFILGCRHFELFELKLHQLQQAGLALRAGAIELAPQLLDLELEMADQSFGARQIRLRAGGLRLGVRRGCFRFQARGALGEDQRMRGSKIGGERFRSGHASDGITSLASGR